MSLLEGLYPEDMLDWRESNLVKDFRRSNPLVLEEVLRAEVLRDAVAPLHPHIPTLLVHELVRPALLARLALTGPLGEELARDELRFEVCSTDRSVLTHTEQVTATILVRPKCPLVRHVELRDLAALVGVDQQGRHHVLELLLLEEGNHEDAAIVGANDRGGRVFVLEDHVCRHLLICT